MSIDEPWLGYTQQPTHTYTLQIDQPWSWPRFSLSLSLPLLFYASCAKIEPKLERRSQLKSFVRKAEILWHLTKKKKGRNKMTKFIAAVYVCSRRFGFWKKKKINLKPFSHSCDMNAINTLFRTWGKKRHIFISFRFLTAIKKKKKSGSSFRCWSV